MASMAFSMSYHYNPKNIIQQKTHQTMNFSPPLRSLSCEEEQQKKKLNDPINRRELILRSSELATLGAIFHFSGTKPSYLGVQKSPPSLALCPATNNCISTSESASDLNHYAPPWNYNPEGGRGSKNPVSKEVAMKELLEVIKSTKPDKFTPKIMEKKDDYVRVEYESPIMGVRFCIC
ncbi:unnamed protein product [Amaranthus hypochondriacus]